MVIFCSGYLVKQNKFAQYTVYTDVNPECSHLQFRFVMQLTGESIFFFSTTTKEHRRYERSCSSGHNYFSRYIFEILISVESAECNSLVQTKEEKTHLVMVKASGIKT